MTRSGEEIFDGLRAAVEKGDTEQTILLQWDLNAEELKSLADAYIKHARVQFAAVEASVTAPSWDATMQPLVLDAILSSLVDSICTFPQHVNPNKEIADASTEADKTLTGFQVEMSSRYELYVAVKAFAESSHPPLGKEQQRMVDHILRDFRRKGLHLEAETRNKVLELNKKMADLGIEFSKNLSEENDTRLFTEAELAGVPESTISSFTKNDEGKFVVNLKYPSYFPIMKHCQVEETRRVMETAFNSRCKAENTKILEELITLRHEEAQLLGYASHAAYITEIRMAKTASAVETFLKELSEKLTPLNEKELQVLLDLKRAEKESRNEPFDGQLHAWDLTYYRQKVEKEKYSVDHEQIKLYFPVEKVTSGLLDIYQELLSLKFTEVKLPTWHEDVKSFEVRNKSDDSLVGYFYLDLFPRERKYGHAACWGLQPSCRRPNGERLLPVAACVCNFSKPTSTHPAYLLHDEVETFFHEFGHACHQLCSLADLASFSGTRVERDFVEAPSQMLENWVWEKEALKRMSCRIEDGACLPDDLIETLIKSRNANAAMLNKRQVVLASFDQAIHTTDHADTAALLAKITYDVAAVRTTPGTNMAASFGHMVGYDAQYYGYLWSEVFSADMYMSRFKQEGIFNPKVGMDYRNFILAPGGSKDASELIRDFLGRDPTPDAFLRAKGLME